MNQVILRNVSEYVTNCFQEHTPGYLTYHNVYHTREVVAHTLEISEYYKLDSGLQLLLQTAAWFHDLGHLFTIPENHEEVSVALMEVFLMNCCSGESIAEIKLLILATKYPTAPLTFLQEIICDADTYHFGTTQFQVTDVLVKNEMEARTGIQYNNWTSYALDMLRKHQFYTSYCKNMLDPGKKENIGRLSAQLAVCSTENSLG